MPVSCCSMTWVTEFCSVCADAPGKVARIDTWGGATSGYCAMGRPMIAPIPASMTMMARTQAKMGRSIKTRLSMVRSARLALGGLHLLQLFGRGGLDLLRAIG